MFFILFSPVPVDGSDVVLAEGVRYPRCTGREVGGGARVTVCHCSSPRCNSDHILGLAEQFGWWDWLAGLMATRM